MSQMESRKRFRIENSDAGDGFKTPEKKISNVIGASGDYHDWGVDEVCGYLRLMGYGEWQQRFRGEVRRSARVYFPLTR